MIRKQLKSGNFLEITIADIKTGYRLYQALMDKVKIEGWEDSDLQKAMTNLILLADDNVMSCILDCAKKCTYEYSGVKQKVEFSTFEREELRNDFLEVCAEILMSNVEPFLPKAPMK